MTKKELKQIALDILKQYNFKYLWYSHNTEAEKCAKYLKDKIYNYKWKHSKLKTWVVIVAKHYFICRNHKNYRSSMGEKAIRILSTLMKDKNFYAVASSMGK